MWCVISVVAVLLSSVTLTFYLLLLLLVHYNNILFDMMMMMVIIIIWYFPDKSCWKVTSVSCIHILSGFFLFIQGTVEPVCNPTSRTHQNASPDDLDSSDLQEDPAPERYSELSSGPGGEPQYQCHFCRYCTPSLVHMQDHLSQHTGECKLLLTRWNMYCAMQHFSLFLSFLSFFLLVFCLFVCFVSFFSILTYK